MQIITFKNRDFDENTYVVLLNNKTIIIDPGTNYDDIKSIINNKKEKIVLLTHGHYDHIKSIKHFDKNKVYAHIKEKALLLNPELNLSIFFNNLIKIKGINFFKGKIIDLDNEIKIFHTPGHTAGSVIIKIQDNIFSGDTLFFDTIGRWDLPTGNEIILYESLKLFSEFDRGSVIYPGHGKNFILDNAFKYNKYLKK